MVPVALFAGSLADRRGRRQLLMVAFAVLPVRALLSGLIDDPVWLIAAEVLDGVASGIVGVAVPVVVADLTWDPAGRRRPSGASTPCRASAGAVGLVRRPVLRAVRLDRRLPGPRRTGARRPRRW